MINAGFILLMQLIIVPLSTLRTTFMVKGRTSIAAGIGFMESLLYVIGLSVIFSDLTNYLNMMAYAMGYAGGVLLGGRIEKALAVGYRTVNVNLLRRDDELVERLRSEGFGVTLFEGEGRDEEKRYRLDILVKRDREKELMQLLEEEVPKAFVIAYEPTSYKGGYLVKSKRKQTLRDWIHGH